MSADNQQGRPQRTLLDPSYIVGFTDGEGSFHVAIYKDPRMRTSFKVIPEFHVSQRESSKSVLEAFVRTFRCGYVKANHAKNPRDRTYVFVVRDRKDLTERVIPFFERHSLRTEKHDDFRTFARIVKLMVLGEHRTTRGLKRILTLAYSMNRHGVRRRFQHSVEEPSETIRRTRRLSGKI